MNRLRATLAFQRNLFLNFLHDNCLQVAAALTYTTLFAVVPVSFVLFTVLKSIPALSSANEQIQQFIFNHFVPSSGTEVMTYLQKFASQSTQLTFIGLAILIVTAILLLRTIEQSINQIWGISQRRKGMVSFLMYWAIISLGPILLASGLLISSWLASSELLSQTLAWANVGSSLYTLMPWLLNVLAFSLIYIVVPNCYVPWRAGLSGALVAATLFELAKFSFTWFVSNLSSYQLIYGAFAAIPLFLLWIHISWLITLLGVEWVKGLVTWSSMQHASKESVFYQSLRVLEYLWRNHTEGHATSAESLGHFLSELGCDHWSEIRQFLLQENLIAVDARGDFLVGRDYHQVQLTDLMRNAPWNMAEWREHISHHSSEAWQKELEEQWQGLEQTVNMQFPQSLQSLLSQLSRTHKNT
ncbi:YihY family inner membrane protein [Litoribrevibacter albus]|nr:YihY family inner membrane protein [Litoribrevibacter albus]